MSLAPKRPRFESDVSPNDDDDFMIRSYGNAAELPRDPYWRGNRCDIPDGPSTYAEIAEGDWARSLMRQAGSDERPFMDIFVANMERGIVHVSPTQGDSQSAVAS